MKCLSHTLLVSFQIAHIRLRCNIEADLPVQQPLRGCGSIDIFCELVVPESSEWLYNSFATFWKRFELHLLIHS